MTLECKYDTSASVRQPTKSHTHKHVTFTPCKSFIPPVTGDRRMNGSNSLSDSILPTDRLVNNITFTRQLQVNSPLKEA